MKDRSKKITGNVGEGIAAEFLKSKGYEIVDRNFSIRYGELDIVARKDGELCFVEVKTFSDFGIGSELFHRPEENVNPKKLQSLARTIKFYLAKKYKEAPKWKFLVAAINLDEEKKSAKIRFIEDVLEEKFTARSLKM